jgi:hypothetical protein
MSNENAYRINLLKHQVHLNNSLFKNPVPTTKKTQRISITKANWLTLFKEVIAVC